MRGLVAILHKSSQRPKFPNLLQRYLRPKWVVGVKLRSEGTSAP